MKKLLFLPVLLGLLLTSCKSNSDVTPVETKLTYEVVTEKDMSWYGEYYIQKEYRYRVDAPNMNYQPNGWKYNTKTTKLPFLMSLSATVGSCIIKTESNVTINVYVNDRLVKSVTNNWGKGVANIEYNVTDEDISNIK